MLYCEACLLGRGNLNSNPSIGCGCAARYVARTAYACPAQLYAKSEASAKAGSFPQLFFFLFIMPSYE
jgi:hypothetical protein